MIPVKVLAVRYLANADPALCRGLGAPRGYSSLALLTTDSDDATYIALDQATKAADVKVCFAHSFYAGAANASTPHAGEVIGILAGATPAQSAAAWKRPLRHWSVWVLRKWKGFRFLHTPSAVLAVI